METHAAKPDEAAASRRVRSRLRLRLPARIETTFGAQDVLLLDLSLTGARVALREAVTVGRDMILAWSLFEAFGRIVWTNHATCGLRFERRLPPEILIATRDLHDCALPRDDRTRVRALAKAWVEGKD